MEVSLQLSIEEALTRSRDGLFFSHYFLPQTFSLEPGPFHFELWKALDDTSNKYVCIEAFRDSAKTTIARSCLLRYICFALCRTVLIVSESSSHSELSLDWIRDKVANNAQLRDTFQLSIGEKDNTTELQIVNSAYGVTINLVAIGINSQLRGLNIQDNRPDFIFVDDAQTYDNSGTPDTAKAINDKFFGSIIPSLAATSVSPFARVVYLGTRSGPEDIIHLCRQDPMWKCYSFSVFLENGESAWPTKWTTKELQEMKDSYVLRNQYSLWMREKECKLVTAEKSAMAEGWYKPFLYLPQKRTFFLGLDPVPPPSEVQIRKNLLGKDYEALTAMCVSQGKVYVEEVRANRGHEIDWTVDNFFELVERYRPRCAGVEAVAYQRTLANTLERERQKRRKSVLIIPIDDKRGKYHRIINEIGSLAQHGNFFIKQDLPNLREQFLNYPGVAHDDELDSCAIGVMAAKKSLGYLFDHDLDPDHVDIDADPYQKVSDSSIPDLPYTNYAP